MRDEAPFGVYRHFREQGKVALAMARAAAIGASTATTMRAKPRPPRVPSATIHAIARPPSAALVADFARHVGHDPGRYAGTLPVSLFPQWSFPLSARLLARTGLPLHRILNAGCRIESFAPLLSDHVVDLSARLIAYDDDGRRIRMTQEITMRSGGTIAAVAALSTYLPLPRRADNEQQAPLEKRAPVLVPEGAERVASYELKPNAGRVFAALTGDVNPIHSVPPIARLAGFRGCILHGFDSFARVHGSLTQLAEARGERLRVLDLVFVKPIVLPQAVSLFSSSMDVFVGLAPGSEAFVRGTFTTEATAR